jgi:hypothetical protein
MCLAEKKLYAKEFVSLVYTITGTDIMTNQEDYILVWSKKDEIIIFEKNNTIINENL